jgi:hypothetical protein
MQLNANASETTLHSSLERCKTIASALLKQGHAHSQLTLNNKTCTVRAVLEELSQGEPQAPEAVEESKDFEVVDIPGVSSESESLSEDDSIVMVIPTLDPDERREANRDRFVKLSELSDDSDSDFEELIP